MKTYAVVVNWNGGEQNVECVAALRAQGLEPERIVLVDNASSDGSVEAVLAAEPGVRVLRNERNLGYGHGTNRGVQLALDEGADAVFLVNNDVLTPEGVLGGLERAFADDPALGVVGPRVLYRRESDLVWSAGGALTFRRNLSTLRGHRRPDGPEYERTLDVDYVAGCSMLVRREVFERVGLLDGEYFAYHEDVEFCLRARQQGFAVRCVGALSVLHDAHGSTGGGYNPRRKYMMAVNTPWFLRRHGTPLRWASFALFDVASLPPLLVLATLRGEWRGAAAKALGTWHGLRGRRVTGEVLEPGGTWLW
jgi:GT2 family glycosyltransferase